jgi:hypothetical protein
MYLAVNERRQQVGHELGYRGAAHFRIDKVGGVLHHFEADQCAAKITLIRKQINEIKLLTV